MLALKSVKDILEFMGLIRESDKKYSLHYVKNVLITVPMVVLLLPLCGYLVFSANSLLRATDVFYVVVATILCIGQYWFLVAQKGPLLDLLSELQALIDQSKCQIEHFQVINGGQFKPLFFSSSKWFSIFFFFVFRRRWIAFILQICAVWTSGLYFYEANESICNFCFIHLFIFTMHLCGNSFYNWKIYS